MSFPASVYFWRFFEWQAALKHSYRNLKAFFRAFFARQEGLERKKERRRQAREVSREPRSPVLEIRRRDLKSGVCSSANPARRKQLNFLRRQNYLSSPLRSPGKGTGNGKRRKNTTRLALTNRIGEKILNPRTIELVMSYAMCRLYHMSRKKVNCFLKKHFPLSAEGI